MYIDKRYVFAPIMEILVTQTLRPIKLAFLIKSDSRKAFADAIEVCSSLWGGKYFPILPIKTRFSRKFREEYQCYEKPLEFYSETIRNYDPDYIVIEEDFEIDFVKKIKGDRKIVSLKDLKTSIEKGETRFGIGLNQILTTMMEKEFKYSRTDGVKLLLPSIKRRDLFCSVLFGTLTNNSAFASFYEPEAEYVALKKVEINNLKDFLTDKFWSPLKVGTYELQSFGNPFWTCATALYIIDHTRLNDLVNFWNLRALGWDIIPIPIEHFHDPFFQGIINDQFSAQPSGDSFFSRITILRGAGITEAAFKIVQEELLKKTKPSTEDETHTESKYSFQWWFPRYWASGESLRYDRTSSSNILSKQETNLIQLDSTKISITAIKLPFINLLQNHGDPIYKIQVSHGYQDYEGRYAEVLPEMDSTNLEVITRGSGFYQWRYSERGAFFLAKDRDALITTYFPEAFRVFEQFFKNSGYEIRLSSIGKLGAELLHNMGGILGINLLMSKEALDVLRLFESGKIVTKSELFGIVSRHRDAIRIETPALFVKSLLSKRIIEFGCEIQCSICNQRSFYTTKELRDILLCAICRNQFKLPEHNPDSIKWSYRGIGPFSRNNKADGLICVFLLLRFFKITLASTNGAITPLLNFEVLKKEYPDREIDLALFYKEIKGSLGRPDLIFCECKTSNDFESKDIDRMRELGKEFPGCMLTFATLKDELADSEKKLIGKLAIYFRKGISERPLNPVLILTKNELTERFGMVAIERLNGSRHLSFTDPMGHLADLTCQKYLGLESFSVVSSRRFDELRKKSLKSQDA